jgi:EpsI family protein
MIARAVTLALIVLGGGAYATRAADPGGAVARTPLARFPCQLEAWRCAGDTPLDPEVIAVLGVDDYVNRTYLSPPAANGGPGGLVAQPIGLYVAYYGSQKRGDSIHSPQNCLPGTGWQPVSAERTTIDAGGTTLPVNKYVVQKGINRQVVFYWYQGRGRVIANEYANKFWLMIDQARLQRSNGSLVRIVAPVPGTSAAALASASAAAQQFARDLYPRLSPYLQ